MSGLDLAAGMSPMVKAFLAGSMSGTCSTLLFQVILSLLGKKISIFLQPLDVVKTRLQSSATRSSMFGEANAVMTAEGLRGLWRGVLPSLYRLTTTRKQLSKMDAYCFTCKWFFCFQDCAWSWALLLFHALDAIFCLPRKTKRWPIPLHWCCCQDFCWLCHDSIYCG